MDNEEETRFRKARLRCHQPPPPSAAHYHYLAKPPMPMNIQSASTSPHLLHANAPRTSLPHSYDPIWLRPKAQPPPPPAYDASPAPLSVPLQDQRQIPLAPFANAGPPGVQFYSTPTGFQPRSFSPYANNWSRGRQL
jgi:hypothetical protein